MDMFITLHNVRSAYITDTISDTVTFVWDNVMPRFGDLLYQAFTSLTKHEATGIVEALIAQQPMCLRLASILTISNNDCLGRLHYHLDLNSLEITVVQRHGVNVLPIINSIPVNEFINHSIGKCCSVKARAFDDWKSNNKNGLYNIFTLDGLMYLLREYIEKLKNISDSSPLMSLYTKRLDRVDGFLSEMNLSQLERDYREIAQKINLEYQSMI